MILSAHHHAHDVMDALNAGATGYVLKADPLDTLMRALDQAARGIRYLAPAVAARLSAIEPSRPTRNGLDILSNRERKIFRLAADCRTAREMARELCLARKTVDTHLNRVNHKLGLRDRAELVRFAVGIGVVHSIRSRFRQPRTGQD